MARPRKPPPSDVTLRSGAVYSEEELAGLAAVALDKIGGTNLEVAERLDVSPSSVSDATNRPEAKLTDLRLKIIALAGYDAEGPLYRFSRRSGE